MDERCVLEVRLIARNEADSSIIQSPFIDSFSTRVSSQPCSIVANKLGSTTDVGRSNYAYSLQKWTPPSHAYWIVTYSLVDLLVPYLTSQHMRVASDTHSEPIATGMYVNHIQRSMESKSSPAGTSSRYGGVARWLGSNTVPRRKFEQFEHYLYNLFIAHLSRLWYYH